MQVLAVTSFAFAAQFYRPCMYLPCPAKSDGGREVRDWSGCDWISFRVLDIDHAQPTRVLCDRGVLLVSTLLAAIKGKVVSSKVKAPGSNVTQNIHAPRRSKGSKTSVLIIHVLSVYMTKDTLRASKALRISNEALNLSIVFANMTFKSPHLASHVIETRVHSSESFLGGIRSCFVSDSGAQGKG